MHLDRSQDKDTDGRLQLFRPHGDQQGCLQFQIRAFTPFGFYVRLWTMNKFRCARHSAVRRKGSFCKRSWLQTQGTHGAKTKHVAGYIGPFFVLNSSVVNGFSG